MTKRELSKWNIEQVTGSEICDAILYLDPDHGTTNRHDGVVGLVIFVVFVIMLAACLWYFW